MMMMDPPPPPNAIVSRTELSSIDARADRAQFGLNGCLVRRRLALVGVLKELPPTEGMVHVARQDGQLIFEAPPPTEQEWRVAADAMQDSAFWQSDIGIEALWEVEGRLEGLRYALDQCRRELDAVQTALDARVNAFVAHGGGSDRTATLAVLHHRRCVLAARHAAQPVPDLVNVFREILCGLERPFTDLPALTDRVHAAAAHLARFLDAHDPIWKDESGRCANVATDPWKMDPAAVDEAVRVMQSRFVGVATVVDQSAWALADLAEKAAEAEYDALLTGLGRRMNRLERDIGELMEQEAEDEGKRFRHGPELDRLANERDALQVVVVEPLLRRYAARYLRASADDAPDDVPAEAWADFHEYGRRSKADYEEFALLHAQAQEAVVEGKQRIAADLAPKRWRYYVLGTLTAVQQHLAAAWQVRRRLTAPDQSVGGSDDEPVRPEQLVAAFAEVVDAEYWRGTPRSAEAFADCLAFLFEWFAIGPLHARYLEALERPEPDPNAPKARAVQRVGAPLPDLHKVAALLAAREGGGVDDRGRQLAALAREWCCASGRVVGGGGGGGALR